MGRISHGSTANTITTFGPNYQHLTWGCAYNHAHFLQYLTDLHNMGANTVRIWLWENMEGLVYNMNNQVTSIDSTFLTNLDDLVNNVAPSAGGNCFALGFPCTPGLCRFSEM